MTCIVGNVQVHEIESYRFGVNSYLRKPVDFDKFTEVMRQVGMYWLLLNELHQKNRGLIMSGKKLNLLILEDEPDDAELEVKELERKGFIIKWRRVETESAFRKALEDRPDLILAGYSLPSFSGMAALRILQEIAPEIPLILISGTIGEELAVDCIKSGATDHIMKDKLYRLDFVVRRALEEAELRRERKRAEEALKESEEQSRTLIQTTSEGYWRINPELKILDVNASLCEMLGYSKQEIIGRTPLDFMDEENLKIFKEQRSRITKSNHRSYEITLKNKNGNDVHTLFNETTLPKKDGRSQGSFALVSDIIDRKKAEIKVIKREKELRFITESSIDVIFTLTKSGKILYISPSSKDIFGFEPNEMVGTSFTGYVPKRELFQYWKALKDVFSHKKFSGFETYVKHSNGNLISVEINGQTIERNGKLIAQGTIRDITERKKAEEKIKAKSLFLEGLIQQLPLPTFVIDSKGFNVMVNDAFLKFYAVPNKEIILGRNALTEPANVKQGVVKYLKEALSGKIVEIPKIEFVSPYKNRKVITRCKLFPILDPTGILTNVVVMQEDITDHKRAEEVLRESEERFRKLLENVLTVAVQGYSADGTIYYWNKANELIYGYTAEEAIGKNLVELIIPPEMRENVQNIIQHGAKTGEMPPATEMTLMRKDGKPVTVYSSHAVVKRDGKETELFCIDVDLTDRKKAEQLQEVLYNIANAANTTGDLNELFESIRDILGSIVDTTNMFIALYDRVTDTISLPYHVDKKEAFTEHPAGKTLSALVIKNGKPLLVTRENIDKMTRDGMVKPVGTSCECWLGVPLKAGKDVIGNVVLQSYSDKIRYTCEDMEVLKFVSGQIAIAIERKKVEEDLTKEKEEVEFYLDLLGHDLGNIHQGILGSLQLLKYDLGENDDQGRVLDIARNSVNRSIALTRDVLLLSMIRNKKARMVEVDLQEIVNNAIRQIMNIFQEKDVDYDLQICKERVRAEPILSELFFNILHNAVRVQGKRPWIEIIAEKKDDRVLISVSDKGPGIPDSMKAQLFRKFGVKGERIRRGIGLSLVKELVDRYNGTIEIRDRVKGDHKQGAKFVVTFPMEDPEADTP